MGYIILPFFVEEIPALFTIRTDITITGAGIAQSLGNIKRNRLLYYAQKGKGGVFVDYVQQLIFVHPIKEHNHLIHTGSKAYGVIKQIKILFLLVVQRQTH